jgi:SpoVK/Ycf46/Vps4 family AAA+-type ATPase
LEPALESRTGRIDQASEFPLPDLESRQRLIASYAKDLPIPDEVIDDLAKRTDGANPAFIKEQLRRVARLHIEGQAKGPVDRAIAGTALHERLLSGGALDTRLLGGNAQAS